MVFANSEQAVQLYVHFYYTPTQRSQLVVIFIKYVVKQKLKNSIQYLDGLKSSLNEPKVFWNAEEGLTEDPVISTSKILDDSPPPQPHY